MGNSLAVRLPAAVAEALKLKEGDEIEVRVLDARELAVCGSPAELSFSNGFTRSADGSRRTGSSTGTRRTPDSFFDTNVPLYLVGSDRAKAERAEALVAQGGAISVQVLNEFENVGCRKMQLAWPDLLAIQETLRDLLHVRGLTLDVHLSSLALAERHRLSVYNAMIVASALDACSRILWSEDMHHGLVGDGRLQLCNPFRAQT